VVSGVDLKRKACTMAEGDGVGAPPNTRIPLRVLLVEDSEIDAEVALRALRRGGYEPKTVSISTLPIALSSLVAFFAITTSRLSQEKPPGDISMFLRWRAI